MFAAVLLHSVTILGQSMRVANYLTLKTSRRFVLSVTQARRANRGIKR